MIGTFARKFGMVALVVLTALSAAGCFPSRGEVFGELRSARHGSYARWRDQIDEDDALPRIDGELSVEEAVKLALEYNPALQGILLEREKARGRTYTAYGEGLPTVDVSANYTRLDRGPAVDIFTGALGDRDNVSVQVNVTQPLFKGGSIGAAIKGAKYYQFLNDEIVRQAVQDVILQTALSYYEVVLAEDQEILPGIESFWVGGHTPGSMAYRVNTAHGKVVFAGDTVSLLANIERNIPLGVFSNRDECVAAMKKIRRKADIVLPSHDPGTLRRWPPAPKDTIKYTIQAIKVGQCEVRDYITFQDSDSEQTSTYYLYVWVIKGGARPIIVETGPKYPEQFSKTTARYIPGGIKQLPEERTVQALKRHGIDPADVSHVIVTHLHADHFDYFDAFRCVVGGTHGKANAVVEDFAHGKGSSLFF